jgi:hypothetical protein
MHPDYIDPKLALALIGGYVIFSLTRKVVLHFRRKRDARRSRSIVGG